MLGLRIIGHTHYPYLAAFATSIEKARQRVGRVPRLKATAGVYKPKIKVLTGQYSRVNPVSDPGARCVITHYPLPITNLHRYAPHLDK